MSAATLVSGSLLLARAGQTDLPALVALQQAAYARNRALLGVEPLPLLADYADILAAHEVWLAREGGALAGAIIAEVRAGDVLLWSIATAPGEQGRGLGGALLAAVETRARQLGRAVVRLYTGTVLAHLVAWYARHGYAIERIEHLPDRSITHMVKHLPTQ